MPLDARKMQQAAEYLAGEHDFVSFCSARNQAEDTIRTLYEVSVSKTDDIITIRLSGNGFLYNMVRIIAGTLIKVGLNIYPPEHVKEILLAESRDAAGPKAPAKGLTLIGIEEQEKLVPVIISHDDCFDYVVAQDDIVSKSRSYVVINYCKDSKFEQVVEHIVRQQIRNGAKKVHVHDKCAGRLKDGIIVGNYTFRLAETEIKPSKEAGKYAASDVEWFVTEDYYIRKDCQLN